MNADSANRRRFTRVIASFPIEVSDGDQACHGYIKDLSLKGVFVGTDEPFNPNTTVSVLMRLGQSGADEDAPTIACEGRVLRNDKDGMAILFNAIVGPDSYTHLRNVILYNAGDPEKAADEIAQYYAEKEVET